MGLESYPTPPPTPPNNEQAPVTPPQSPPLGAEQQVGGVLFLDQEVFGPETDELLAFEAILNYGQSPAQIMQGEEQAPAVVLEVPHGPVEIQYDGWTLDSILDWTPGEDGQ